MPTRRVFLKNSALAMFGIGAAPAWLGRALYGQENNSSLRRKTLVVIFQRGAVDGLNVVIPHGDPAYYTMRPTLAIPRPGSAGQSAIDLDGHFGLHPSLAPLKPLWDRKELGIIEAAGSPDPTRSHFDAQDYMESGTPGIKATPDGWLNRALPSEAHPSVVRAVSVGSDLPRALRGRNGAIVIGNINEFQVKDHQAANLFSTLYGSSADTTLQGAGRDAFDAAKIVQTVANTPYTPANGAHYPGSRLGKSLGQIAQLIRSNVGLEVAFTDVGGWDTHVNQSGAQPHVGQLANLLNDFGNSLAAFAQDMGDRMEDVVLVTMSEFGRTARENGNRGTDHGHANCMFVLGGRVQGGRVYGHWPGLASEQLYEGRDLNVTTDFRTVLSELVRAQLSSGGNVETVRGGWPRAESLAEAVPSVFPGFHGPQRLGLVA